MEDALKFDVYLLRSHMSTCDITEVLVCFVWPASVGMKLLYV